MRDFVRTCQRGNLCLELVRREAQEPQVLHVEPHGLVQRQVGLRGHGVGLVVLLRLLLQLQDDSVGARAEHLLPPDLK